MTQQSLPHRLRWGILLDQLAQSDDLTPQVLVLLLGLIQLLGVRGISRSTVLSHMTITH